MEDRENPSDLDALQRMSCNVNVPVPGWSPIAPSHREVFKFPEPENQRTTVIENQRTEESTTSATIPVNSPGSDRTRQLGEIIRKGEPSWDPKSSR
jgi:hypothetical protein